METIKDVMRSIKEKVADLEKLLDAKFEDQLGKKPLKHYMCIIADGGPNGTDWEVEGEYESFEDACKAFATMAHWKVDAIKDCVREMPDAI